MVIVTKNQYVLASKINHIKLDEEITTVSITQQNGKIKDIPVINYVITIDYEPASSSHSKECTVYLKNKIDAYSVFRDIVNQIREQMPDELYLDQAISSLLKQYPLEDIKSSKLEIPLAEDIISNEGRNSWYDDRSSKKIRSARTKKRRG